VLTPKLGVALGFAAAKPAERLGHGEPPKAELGREAVLTPTLGVALGGAVAGLAERLGQGEPPKVELG
jgi:hypothetical protein